MGSQHCHQLCPSQWVRPLGPGVGFGLGDPQCPGPFNEFSGTQDGPVSRGSRDISQKRSAEFGYSYVQAPAGVPPQQIRIRTGERCPIFADTVGLGAQEERPGVSTAPMRLIIENFPLFSPRTSESPCTGTKRSPDDPLGVLQEAFGEADLGG